MAGYGLPDNDPVMSRRVVIALLWFAAILVGYELLWSLTGVPRSVGPIIATAVAAAITIDSPGLFRARGAAEPLSQEG